MAAPRKQRQMWGEDETRWAADRFNHYARTMQNRVEIIKVVQADHARERVHRGFPVREIAALTGKIDRLIQDQDEALIPGSLFLLISYIINIIIIISILIQYYYFLSKEVVLI